MMTRNKRASLFLSITIAVTIWIFGILFIPFLVDDITTTRIALSCASPALLSGGEMITCLMIDTIVPYLIWTIVSLALGFAFGGE